MEHLAIAIEALTKRSGSDKQAALDNRKKEGPLVALRLLLPFFLVVASAIVIIFGLRATPARALGAEPTLAHIDGTQTFTHHVNPMSYMRFMHYRGVGGEVCYCADYQLHGPADGGTVYPRGADAVYGPLEYYVEHGYPSTTFIAGREWSQDEAETLTQISIWIYRGSVGLDGSFTDGEGHNYNMHNIDGDPRDATLFDAAVSFYYEGLTSYTQYGKNFCYLWTQPDAGHQNMLLGLVWVGTADLVIQKTSARPDVTDNNENYSLEGAIYDIYRDAACTDLAFTKTLSSNGSVKIENITPGKYYLRETVAPPGYKLNKAIQEFEIYALTATTITTKDDPWMGRIQVEKRDAWPQLSDGNSLYSLAGAQFQVIQTNASSQFSSIITCDASGKGTTGDLLPLGTYQVFETHAPVGYAINTTTVAVRLTQSAAEKNVPVFVCFNENPQYDPGEMLIAKKDAETLDSEPLGAGSLAGCIFRVSYYANITDPENLPDTPTRSWLIKTDKEGKTSLKRAATDPETYFVDGPAFYKNQQDSVVYPLGVVNVEEVEAPTGYKIAETQAFTYVINGTDDGILERRVVQDSLVPEQVFRGDLEFIKANGDTQERLSNVPFLITSLSTGESHVAVTDENGFFSSNIENYLHSDNTNANDKAVTKTHTADGNVTYAVDEEMLTPAAGTWFYGHNDPARNNPVNDDLRALPYDTYRVEELPCTANEGLVLVDVKATVTRDNQLIKFGTIDDNTFPPDEPDDTPAASSSSERLPKTGAEVISFVSFSIAGAASTVLGIAKYKKAHPPKNPYGHVW